MLAIGVHIGFKGLRNFKQGFKFVQITIHYYNLRRIGRSG